MSCHRMTLCCSATPTCRCQCGVQFRLWATVQRHRALVHRRCAEVCRKVASSPWIPWNQPRPVTERGETPFRLCTRQYTWLGCPPQRQPPKNTVGAPAAPFQKMMSAWQRTGRNCSERTFAWSSTASHRIMLGCAEAHISNMYTKQHLLWAPTHKPRLSTKKTQELATTNSLDQTP